MKIQKELWILARKEHPEASLFWASSELLATIQKEENEMGNNKGVYTGEKRTCALHLTYPPNEPVKEAGLGEAVIVLLPEDSCPVPEAKL